MVKPVDGPRPKPVVVAAEAVGAAVVAKSAPPVSKGAVPPGSGFEDVKKRPVSITGRYPAGKAPAPADLPEMVVAKLDAAAPAIAAGSKAPADVAKLISDGTKLKERDDPAGNYKKKEATRAKGEFANVEASIAKGDYQAAAESMGKLLSKDEDVLKSLGDGAVASSYTVKAQLEFLGKLQAAGVKADYPPTEAQLTAYFKTLKGKPDEARAAFADYAKNFHVHPANVPGADADVKYSPDKMKTVKDVDITTSVPNDWSEVSGRSPGKGANADSIGKSMNDCEGYAYMAEKLLGAAGFELTGHLTVGGDSQHAMAMFKHPKEKGVTITSNDAVFTGPKARGVANEAFAYASPDGTTGKEPIFIGKTMADSQVASMSNGKKLD